MQTRFFKQNIFFQPVHEAIREISEAIRTGKEDDDRRNPSRRDRQADKRNRGRGRVHRRRVFQSQFREIYAHDSGGIPQDARFDGESENKGQSKKLIADKNKQAKTSR